MGTRGLTKEKIVAEAVAYIEHTGQPTISLHELARRLDVKPPSLYNHIQNTKELQYAVFQYAIDHLVAHQKNAVEQLKGDEAVRAFSRAYLAFAAAHKGLYRLIMTMPSEQDEQAKELALPLLELVVDLLSSYGLCADDIAHWQRVLRAILHGFLSQEDLGYFYYYNSIDLEKSRELAVQCFLDGLHTFLNHTVKAEQE